MCFKGRRFFPSEPRCRRGWVSPPLIVPRSFMFCSAVPAGGCYADFLLCKVKQNKDGTVCTKSTNTKRQMHTCIHTEKSNWNEFLTGKIHQLKGKERKVDCRKYKQHNLCAIYIANCLNCFMLLNKKGMLSTLQMQGSHFDHNYKYGTIKGNFAYSKKGGYSSILHCFQFICFSIPGQFSVAADLYSRTFQ